MTDAAKLITYLIKNKRWHWCCLLFFYLFSCHHSPEYKRLVLTKEDSAKKATLIKRAFAKISIAQNDIQNGDIVTRVGNDFTSECLRQINVRDKTWSHCGIASIEHDSIFIYHALGGEFNPDQQLRRDYLPAFANPNTNRGMGIFRQQLSVKELYYLLIVVKKLYAAGVMFDMKFDLQTDERMYCAEFVYKSFLWATNQRLRFNTSTVKEKVFVGVDDIFLYPRCRQVQQIFYKD
jgi:uncharacterized protein YnzC (UPF0291/DUF896 family)